MLMRPVRSDASTVDVRLVSALGDGRAVVLIEVSSCRQLYSRVRLGVSRVERVTGLTRGRFDLLHDLGSFELDEEAGIIRIYEYGCNRQALISGCKTSS